MNVDEMKREIINLLSERGNASFVELERIDGFIDHSKNKKDTYELFGVIEFNIFWWANLSDSAITAINELKADGIIKLCVCNFLIYMIDGKSLGLPIAKKIMKYKKPRWMPIEIKLLTKI